MVTLASESEEAQRPSFKAKEFSGSFALCLNLASLNNKARGQSLWARKGKSREAQSRLVIAQS